MAIKSTSEGPKTSNDDCGALCVEKIRDCRVRFQFFACATLPNDVGVV